MVFQLERRKNKILSLKSRSEVCLVDKANEPTVWSSEREMKGISAAIGEIAMIRDIVGGRGNGRDGIDKVQQMKARGCIEQEDEIGDE